MLYACSKYPGLGNLAATFMLGGILIKVVELALFFFWYIPCTSRCFSQYRTHPQRTRHTRTRDPHPPGRHTVTPRPDRAPRDPNSASTAQRTAPRCHTPPQRLADRASSAMALPRRMAGRGDAVVRKRAMDADAARLGARALLAAQHGQQRRAI